MQHNLLGTDQSHSNDQRRNLHIVADGQIVDLPPTEIFDSRLFDTLYAVTYVSSARFFSKMTKNFATVKFIVGIPDADVLKQFAAGIQPFVDVEERVRFWNDLDDDLKEGVQTDRITLRYTAFGNPPNVIHTKLYLLSHSQTQCTRVIIGSANFTEQAFYGRSQFEDIEIFNNDLYRYQVYLERFEQISAHTIDYIPDRCRTKASGVVYTDAETLKQVLLEEAERFRKIIVIPQEGVQQLEALPVELTYRKEEADRTNKVVRLLTTPKNGQHVLQSTKQLLKQSVALQTAVSRVNKDSERNDSRNRLHYLRSEHRLLMDKQNEQDLISFSMPSDKDTIRFSLDLIHAFIDAYGTFTVNPDPRTQSKIAEILLYAFTSPFIWKIREDHVEREGRASVRASFQPFLIIAGRPFSGKTTALEFISVLLGHHGERYFPYSKVDGRSVLLDYFHTENVYPILIDEIPINFFTSTDRTKGESLIKHVSNDLDSIHPVMIATTNQTEFNVSGQTLRRIYYVEISDVFDKNRKVEADRYLNNVMAQANTTLFRDFTHRFGQRIQSHAQFYAPDDFLAGARAIFRDYYQEVGLDIPSWFPEGILADYEDRGHRVWRQTFSEYRNAFRENIVEDTIFVDTTAFCEHPKKRQQFINFLDQGCIREDSVILVLARQKFYDFINVDPEFSPAPSEKMSSGASTPSLWQRITSLFR